MNTVLRHIEYLISRNDCVIIPDFGALLANKASAVYHEEELKIIPPRRVFTFNSDLKHNDGLLVTSIQRTEGISYEAAAKRVQKAVDTMLTQLSWTGELKLGNIGTLRRSDTDGLMTFDCENQQCLSPDMLWLRPIKLERIDIIDSHDTQDLPIQVKRYNPLKRFIKAAASIAILLGIGFLASTPIPVDDAMLASLAPDVYKVDYSELLPEKETATTLDILLPAPSDDSMITIAENAVHNLNQYCVVIASVSSKRDVNQFKAEHPNLKLGHHDMGPYYILYTEVYNDIYDAYRACEKASEIYPDAWVCRK